MLKRSDNKDFDFPKSSETSSKKAIVIGAGFGGLAAAMRLGSKGYKVSVFDKLNSLGGRGTSLNQNGYRFDLGPTIVTLPNMFRSLWNDCGRDFDKDVNLKPLDPFYKIKFPDNSEFLASNDSNKMKKQIESLFPNDLGGYEKFMRESKIRYDIAFSDEKSIGRVSMHKLWDTLKVLPLFGLLRADRSVYQMAAARVKDPRLRFALSFHPLFVGGDPFNVTSMWGLVSHIEKVYGVHCAIGGFSAIAKAMGRIILEQGGSIHLNSEVKEITYNRKNVTGVKLKDNRSFEANIIISNSDPSYTYNELLKKKEKKRWTSKKFKNKKWSMGLFVWHFGTKNTKNMWPDVGHHTILHGPRYSGHVKDIFINGVLSEDMSLYIHRPSVTDPTCAPENCDTFYVLSCVPHLGHSNPIIWEKEKEKYLKKVAQFLDNRLLPGFQKTLVESHVMTPNDFGKNYLSPMGTGFSIEPRMFQSAWFRPHNISEEIEGLYLVGAGTHPGPGVPGVIASAEIIAKEIKDAKQYQKENNNFYEKIDAR